MWGVGYVQSTYPGEANMKNRGQISLAGTIELHSQRTERTVTLCKCTNCTLAATVVATSSPRFHMPLPHRAMVKVAVGQMTSTSSKQQNFDVRVLD